MAALFLSLIRVPACAAEETSASDRWTLLSEQDVRAMQQAYLDRMAAPRNPHAESAVEWEARKAAVRRHVLDSLALLPEPERLPLNVHVSGELDRDGYVVKRIYWQTWPSYYASGYLYLPKHSDGKVPGILNPHGHFEHGARNPVVQSRLIALAKKGYVCLAVDSVHAYDYYAGVTPIAIMTWNNIRGIDLLSSLPEVDPDRIGCTGCSGGGQQTFYMMALDDRIKAAVPVNLVSEARRILAIEMHHCPCNHVAGLMAETDETEISAVFAPKPALYICVTQDWTKWFPHEGYPEIRSIYELYDATDRVECIQHDWRHDYSRPMREQAYAWFNRWLRGIDDSGQAEEGEIQPESLETLAALDGPPPDARGPEAVFEEVRARRAARAFETNSAEAVRESSARVRKALRRLFRRPERFVDPEPRVLSRERLDGVLIIRLLIRTEPDIRVPLVLLLPDGRSRQLPGLVVASSEGKAAVLTSHWNELASLAREGACVAVADVRLFGEWSLDAHIQRLNGVFFGRPPAAVGTHDLLAITAWLRSRPEVRADAVGVLGLGDAGPLALMAAALDPQIALAAAPDIGRTYAAGRVDPTASHLITLGDLPEIAAACAPRPLWVAGMVERRAWDITREAYSGVGGPGRLQIGSVLESPWGDGAQAWLRLHLATND